MINEHNLKYLMTYVLCMSYVKENFALMKRVMKDIQIFLFLVNEDEKYKKFIDIYGNGNQPHLSTYHTYNFLKIKRIS